ncbi:hypothetical protein BCh11DRAFT_06479 [Burkholderia sp. Ch1-1]|nr:hypothetical protein BCh11DRAFT_06479 [Burkholderia sp. Ch1-1]
MRKSTVFTATDGRDKGKAFLITELPAEEAEDWAMRALFTMVNAGVEIPDELLGAGLAGLAALGLKSLTKVPYDAAKPLFQTMMQCVQVLPDPRDHRTVRPLMTDEDIEEVSTRLALRKAVMNLHMGFFLDAARSQSAADAAPQTPT